MTTTTHPTRPTLTSINSTDTSIEDAQDHDAQDHDVQLGHSARQHLSLVPNEGSLPPPDRTAGLCAAFALLGVPSLARGAKCITEINGRVVIAERTHGEIDALIACDGNSDRRRWWAPLHGAVSAETIARELLPLVTVLESTRPDELPDMPTDMTEDRLIGLLRRESERGRLDRRRARQVAFRCWVSNPQRHPDFETSAELFAALRLLRGVDGCEVIEKAVHR